MTRIQEAFELIATMSCLFAAFGSDTNGEGALWTAAAVVWGATYFVHRSTRLNGVR
jgi:hypothetical protein